MTHDEDEVTNPSCAPGAGPTGNPNRPPDEEPPEEITQVDSPRDHLRHGDHLPTDQEDTPSTFDADVLLLLDP